jgi:hypothetical protein
MDMNIRIDSAAHRVAAPLLADDLGRPVTAGRNADPWASRRQAETRLQRAIDRKLDTIADVVRVILILAVAYAGAGVVRGMTAVLAGAVHGAAPMTLATR